MPVCNKLNEMEPFTQLNYINEIRSLFQLRVHLFINAFFVFDSSLVLIFIYCRYKSIAAKLIALKTIAL
jgi:hypothetical protein